MDEPITEIIDSASVLLEGFVEGLPRLWTR